MSNPFRRLATSIANEPIVHISGTLAAVVTWLFTYVSSGWDPSTHQQQIAGLTTGAAYALALIARQFVTPAAKVARIPVPAPVVLDAAVVPSAVLTPDPIPAPAVDDTPYPFDTAEAAQAALDARPAESTPAPVAAPVAAPVGNTVGT